MDIVLNDVDKSFDEKQVFHRLNCRFPEGEITCVLGPSGCGKTTLLRMIAGLESPDAGEIIGQGYQKNSAVFQENRLFENLTAEKNLMLTARRGFSRADALALLDELGLGAEASTPVNRLSGGMQRRVAVARALAADYDLLLLDEPLTGLDGGTRRSVLEVIRRHSAGRTRIWVTHDPADVHLLNAHTLHLSEIAD